jgi:hypothetical protein
LHDRNFFQDSLRHFGDPLRGVHGDDDPPVGVVVLEGLGLLMADPEAVPDRLLLIVLALDEGTGVYLGVIRRRVVLGVVNVARRLARTARPGP